MNLLAFKALKREQEYLLSPLCTAIWQRKFIPELGGEFYFVKADQLPSSGNQYGIHGGTWDEACLYGEEIYIVAPLPSPDTAIVLGTAGWRASAAIVVDGPYDSKKDEDKRRAAQVIMSYHLMGYESVRDVLIESCLISGKDRIPILTEIASSIDDVSSFIKVVATTCKGPDDNTTNLIIKAFRSLERKAKDKKGFLREKAKPLISDPFSTDREATQAIYSMRSLEKEAIPYLTGLALSWEPILRKAKKDIVISPCSALVALIFVCSKIGKEAIPILERLLKYKITHRIIASECYSLGVDAIPLLERIAIENIGNEPVLRDVASACERLEDEFCT
ncbi:MAG: hypothetical protein QXT73_06795 [Candidatus Methanomethylicaceae archaeon]